METLSLPRLLGRVWGAATLLMMVGVVLGVAGFFIVVAHDVVSGFEQGSEQGNAVAQGSDDSGLTDSAPAQVAPRYHPARHKTHHVARRCTCRRAADFGGLYYNAPLSPSAAAELAYLQAHP